MDLGTLSQQVVSRLADTESKLVLAESCTAGLIAASLGGIPGVSQFLCGSAVAYREQTKIDWLNVNPDCIRSKTAVSIETTDQITSGVLYKTKEADWALGITGHLGPGSPPDLDGQIFVACYQRAGEEVAPLRSATHQLEEESRLERQREAAAFALQFLVECLTH